MEQARLLYVGDGIVGQRELRLVIVDWYHLYCDLNSVAVVLSIGYIERDAAVCERGFILCVGEVQGTKVHFKCFYVV